jgi:hypothetical protein
VSHVQSIRRHARHSLEDEPANFVELARRQVGNVVGHVAVREGDAAASEIVEDGVDLRGEHVGLRPVPAVEFGSVSVGSAGNAGSTPV